MPYPTLSIRHSKKSRSILLMTTKLWRNGEIHFRHSQLCHFDITKNVDMTKNYDKNFLPYPTLSFRHSKKSRSILFMATKLWRNGKIHFCHPNFVISTYLKMSKWQKIMTKFFVILTLSFCHSKKSRSILFMTTELWRNGEIHFRHSQLCHFAIAKNLEASCLWQQNYDEMVKFMCARHEYLL